VQRFAAAGPAPDDPPLHSEPGIVSRYFVMLPQGEFLLRTTGDPRVAAMPMLLLHDAPGSSLALEPMMQALSARGLVLTLDLPGCGESPPLQGESASLADVASVVRDLLDKIGVQRCALYAIGFGSTLALQLAAEDPARFPQLLLQGLCLADDAQRSAMRLRYAPEIALQDDGSHWYRCWLMLRDSLIYFPWYDGRAAALRRVAADFDAQVLHQRTFETVKQLKGYPQFIRAALAQDTQSQCRVVARRGVNVTVLQDPLHPFAAFARQEAALAATLRWPLLSSANASTIEALRQLA
jgi:pimeloyl-ACP methyl ester carboxylesterase